MSQFENLVTRLSAYFVSFARSRDVGRGTAFPTTGEVTGGLQANDRFYRTDLDWLCYYDGTRWLTLFEFQAAMGDATLTTSDTFVVIAPLRTDYAPYVTRVAVAVRIPSGASDGSNYWTWTMRGVNATYTAASSIHQDITAAAVSGAPFVLGDGAPNVTATPANRAQFDFYAAKTGAPGNLVAAAALYYRLIVT